MILAMVFATMLESNNGYFYAKFQLWLSRLMLKTNIF